MNDIKTKDLRPCDNCNGAIIPVFYRVRVSLRMLMIDQRAVKEVMGTAQIVGDLEIASVMSPNQNATIEMPGYKIDKDLFLCQECVLNFSIKPVDLMVESESQQRKED